MVDASVKILDEKYIIQVRHEEQDPKLKECDGYTDTTIKRIVICDRRSDDKMQVENPEVVIDKVLRHEMVHAFLYESGLSINSWADNEEIVDWIAIQFPKMQEAFDEVFSEETESGGSTMYRRGFTENRECKDCKYFDKDIKDEPCYSCSKNDWHDKWEEKDNVSESD